MKSKKKIALIVLLSLCALSIVIYSHLATRYTVTIVNQSESPVDNIQISGGGSETRIGQLKANSTITKTLSFSNDGQLEFRSNLNTEPHIIDGYVTGNVKGDTSVIIDKNGKVSHKNRQ